MAVSMNTKKANAGATQPVYEVIHPLSDVAEKKRSPEGLGPMRMSRSVKLSLMALRAYLISIILLVGYHVIMLARHHGH